MTRVIPSYSARAGARYAAIALGHPLRGDDGAALEVVRRLRPGLATVIEAGRPGAGLLDLLDPDVPTILVDVVRSGREPGTLVTVELDRLPELGVRQPRASSHGLGPADALALARALGRPLPRGWFVGVEGERFDAGTDRSPAVEAALEAWVATVERLCTSMG